MRFLQSPNELGLPGGWNPAEDGDGARRHSPTVRAAEDDGLQESHTPHAPGSRGRVPPRATDPPGPNRLCGVEDALFSGCSRGLTDARRCRIEKPPERRL